jgi:hypothetical protein
VARGGGGAGARALPRFRSDAGRRATRMRVNWCKWTARITTGFYARFTERETTEAAMGNLQVLRDDTLPLL